MYALVLFYCIDICMWLSSKEIHKEDTRYWKREIPRLMCQMKQYLPTTFFNAQEHYLIHQVEEIELCGTSTQKVDVDGGEAVEVTKGFC